MSKARFWKMKAGGITYNQFLAECKAKGVRISGDALTLMQDPLFKTPKQEIDVLVMEFLLGGMIGEDPATNPRDWADIMRRTSVARINKLSACYAVHFALQVSDVEMKPNDKFVVMMHAVDNKAFIVRCLRSGQIELDAFDVRNIGGILSQNTWAIIQGDPRTENQDQIPWLGKSSQPGGCR